MKYIVFTVILFLSFQVSSYDVYPPEIDELVYFSVGKEWGDPNKKDKFRVIKLAKDSIITEQKTYPTIEHLINSTELNGVSGIAIDIEDHWDWDESETVKIIKKIKKSGITRVIEKGTPQWIKARQMYLSRTTGIVSGIVKSAETGKPLQGVYISTRHFGDSTDKEGHFTVSNLDPGVVVLEAKRIDLITAKIVDEIEVRKSKFVEITMHEAPAACCKLDGKWRLMLRVSEDRRRPEDRPDSIPDKVIGRVTFGEQYAESLSSELDNLPKTVHHRFGEYDLDLTTIFGKDFTKTGSTTIIGSDSKIDPLKQASGIIYDANVVEISFIPNMSHGGLSLSGIIVRGDSIRGNWHKRDIATQVSGRFWMNRID